VTQSRAEWDFMLTLATTALVIVGVVLVYLLLTYRRARVAAEAARRAVDESHPPLAVEEAGEPVFFKRYLPADRE